MPTPVSPSAYKTGCNRAADSGPRLFSAIPAYHAVPSGSQVFFFFFFYAERMQNV